MADHKHFVESLQTRVFFDVLRTNVLALDLCVTEEFLKRYVAFKAEINFVDVVLQAKWLRLTLTLEFHDLHDPRGIAKDVTIVGGWGDVKVEVVLGSQGRIRCVMGSSGMRLRGRWATARTAPNSNQLMM
jgi:predicted transport protein